MRFYSRRALLLCALASLGESARTSSASAKSGMSAQATSLWNSYVSRVTKESKEGHRGFQPGCEPKKWESTTGSYRGVILLYHGLTACSEQYDLLAPKLTARGYVVLAPTVPGHGLDYDHAPADSQDDITTLPNSPTSYQEFAQEMNSIVDVAGGESAVMGLSLGGALASYSAYTGNYDRRMITVPYIRAAGIGDKILELIKFTPSLAAKRQSWGESCEVRRHATDRAGYCQFSGGNVRAARDFGQGHSWSIRKKAPPGSTQFIYVDGHHHTTDGAVMINAIERLATNLGVDIKGPHYCGLDEGIPHSYLSTKDNYGMNMYWLNETMDMITEFLAEGTPVAQEGHINFRGRCAIKCTPSDPKCTNIHTPP